MPIFVQLIYRCLLLNFKRLWVVCSLNKAVVFIHCVEALGSCVMCPLKPLSQSYFSIHSLVFTLLGKVILLPVTQMLQQMSQTCYL